MIQSSRHPDRLHFCACVCVCMHTHTHTNTYSHAQMYLFYVHEVLTSQGRLFQMRDGICKGQKNALLPFVFNICIYVTRSLPFTNARWHFLRDGICKGQKNAPKPFVFNIFTRSLPFTNARRHFWPFSNTGWRPCDIYADVKCTWQRGDCVLYKDGMLMCLASVHIV